MLRFWSLLKGRRPSPHQSEAFLVPRLPRWAQATMPTPHAHVTIGQPSHGHCGRLPSWAFQLSCGTCRTADPGRPSGFCGSHLRSGHSLSGGAASDGGTAHSGEPASDWGIARFREPASDWGIARSGAASLRSGHCPSGGPILRSGHCPSGGASLRSGHCSWACAPFSCCRPVSLPASIYPIPSRVPALLPPALFSFTSLLPGRFQRGSHGLASELCAVGHLALPL